MSGYKVINMPTGSDDIEQYEGFIISSFLRSLRDQSPWMQSIDQKQYFKTYGDIIKNTLDNSGGDVRIAVLADEPDTAVGWSLSFGKTLLYVYVKKYMRKNGIGSSLMPEELRKQQKGAIN